MSKATTFNYETEKYSYLITKDEKVILYLYERDSTENISSSKTKISTRKIPDAASKTPEQKNEFAKDLIRAHYRAEIQKLDDDIPFTYHQESFMAYVKNRENLQELESIRGWNPQEYSTVDAYENALINQWGNAIDNDIPFYKLTKAHCDAALEEIKKTSSGISVNRCNWLINVLRQLMNYAVSKGHRKDNPLYSEKLNTNDETKQIVKRHRLKSNTLTCDEMRLLFDE